MLNVAFIYLSGDTSHIGGIQKLTYELSKRHIMEGHKTIIISPFDSTTTNKGTYNLKDAKIYKLPMFKQIFGKRIYKGFAHISVLKIMRILKREKIDIVQIMDTTTYHGYIARMSKLFGLKVVSSIISSSGEFGTDKEKMMILKYSDIIVAASEYNKIKFGPYEKIRIIPLGCNSKSLNSTKDKKNIILAVGRVDKRKNYSILIKAIKIVTDKKKDIKCYIVGTIDYPSYMKELKNTIKREKLEKHIEFLGYMPEKELDKIYRKSKIFYLPSKHEMFGIVFAEAMTYGLPIISSNSTAIPEVVGNAGILLDANDYHSHANAIINLLEDKTQYKSLRKNALKKAKIYRWDNTYKKILEIYKKLENEHP
ncbi:MAG: hypothetical protein DRP85_07380 [Candidatus Makaraimicrobium thalassicum]|nr:MAG: hypothetical protein DRP85_07380 [Candidatus Omnitrophota bacterium]